MAGVARLGEKQGLLPGGPYGGVIGDRNNKHASVC